MAKRVRAIVAARRLERTRAADTPRPIGRIPTVRTLASTVADLNIFRLRLASPPVHTVGLPPPPPPIFALVLPIPVYRPVPVCARWRT
jgi:hypothetical protein